MKDAPSSILQQSKQSQWYRKWWIIGVILLGVAGSFTFVFRGSLFPTALIIEEVKLYTVKKDNIQVLVEGEGKIINPNVANLSFLTDGTLESVLVEEGQKVKKGDVLAELETQDLEFDLKDARNQVQIVNANIRAKNSEILDDSLRVTENEIIISQQNLENAELDYEQSINQALDLGIIEIESALPEIKKNLEVIDEIFGLDKNQAKYEAVGNSFNNSILENDVKEQYRTLKRLQKELVDEYQITDFSRDGEVARFLWKLKGGVAILQKSLENLVDIFDTIGAISSQTSQSEVDSAESSVKSALTSINSLISSLTSARQHIEDAYLTQENGLKSAGNSLRSTEIKLENSQLDLAQREISKASSLSILYAQLDQAKVKVEKAQYNLSQATLKAPIDGEVIAVNANTGETVKVQSTTSDNALIRILSDDNFTTEIYVEEVDIAKIKKGQKAIITLDALEDVTLEGEVSYIASTATIDNNSITTYLVRVNITDTQEQAIKEGMTTYVEFIIGQALDVVKIPVSSIVRDKFVQLADGTRKEVTTGFSDGSFIEITDGLSEGDVIISNSQAKASGRGGGAGTAGARELTDERKKEMKTAGFTDEELANIAKGEITDEMKEKMQTMREQTGSGRSGFGGGRMPH